MRKSLAAATLITGLCILWALTISGCGGKKASASERNISVATTTQIIKTAFKYAGTSFGSAMNPFTASGLGRIGTKSMEKALSRNAGSVSGSTAGNTTTYTYTGEKYEGCAMDGTVAFTHNFDSAGNATGTISGALALTQCATAPATYTVTISAGNITTACTNGTSTGCSAGVTTYTATLTLSSATITGSGSLSGSETFNSAANPAVDNLTTLVRATRSDGSHSTGTCAYAATSTSVSCTENGAMADGTLFNLSTTVSNAGTVTISGSETMTDGTVINYTPGSYFYSDKSGLVSFTASNGYSGSFTFNFGGGGLGSILDNNGLIAATMTWSDNGAVTIEFSDYSTQTFNAV